MSSKRWIGVVLAAVLGLAGVAQAQDTTALFPLRMMMPASSVPTGHRITVAYPGIEYAFPIACVGGAFPFTYALSGQPSGMTVATNGFVTWSNPTVGSYGPITASCTDNAGTTVSNTWSLTVTTTGFYFVSPSGDDTTGTGAIGAPWKTVDKAIKNTSGGVTYFRGGTYTVNENQTSTATSCNSGGFSTTQACRDPSDGHYTRRVRTSDGQSVIWLAYPGETPVFDFACPPSTVLTNPVPAACDTESPHIMMIGAVVFLDSLSMKNLGVKGFEFQPQSAAVPNGWVAWRNTVTDAGYGLASANASAFFSFGDNNPLDPKVGSYFGYNTASGMDGNRQNHKDFTKFYDEQYLLVVGNHVISTVDRANSTDGELDLKADVTYTDVRLNQCDTGVIGTCFGGNFNRNSYIDVRYNLLRTNSATYTDTGERPQAAILNQIQTASYIRFRRNSIDVGRVTIREAITGTSGTFEFSGNVIQNAEPAQLHAGFCDGAPTGGWTDCPGVTNDSVMTFSTNTAGSSGLIDASGLLVNRANVGTYGWELAASDGGSGGSGGGGGVSSPSTYARRAYRRLGR